MGKHKHTCTLVQAQEFNQQSSLLVLLDLARGTTGASNRVHSPGAIGSSRPLNRTVYGPTNNEMY